MQVKSFLNRSTAVWMAVFMVLSLLLPLMALGLPQEEVHVYYEDYANPYDVYTAIEMLDENKAALRKIHPGRDDTEVFWVTKANKAASIANFRYTVIGWHLDIMKGSDKVSADYVESPENVGNPFEANCIVNNYYYNVKTINIQKVYADIFNRGGSDAETLDRIMQKRDYTVIAYPIMSTKNSGSTVANGRLTQLANGYVEHSGYVYFLNTEVGYKGIRGAVTWSNSSYEVFDDYHDGRRTNLSTNNYTISYKIHDADTMNGDWSLGTGDYLYKDGKKYTTSISSYKGGAFLSEVTARRTGYTLDYFWTLEGTNNTYAYGSQANAKQLGGNITVVGSWTPNTYHISYDANGGSGNVAPQACTYDKTYTYSDGSLLSRRGYKFCGWSRDADASYTSGMLIHPGEEFKNLTPNDATITLYAIWEPDEYVIGLDRTGGNGGLNEFYEKYSVRFTETSGALQNITGLKSTPYKYGYDFAGYYTGYNGTGERITTDSGSKNYGAATIVVDNKFFVNNTTVYAHYVPKRPYINFDFDGGIGGTEKVRATFGEYVPTVTETGASVIAPVKDGMIFKGYFTKPNGQGIQYYSESMAGIKVCDFEEDLTLYAYWEDGIVPTICLIPDASGWTNQDVGMTVRARDLGSGLSKVEIYLKDFNGAPVATFSAANGDFEAGTTSEFVRQNAYICRTEGVYTYYARAYDVAGNTADACCVVYLDKTPPTIYGQSETVDITFTSPNQTIEKQNVRATLSGDTIEMEFTITDYK